MSSVEKPVVDQSQNTKDSMSTSETVENTTFRSYNKVHNTSHNTTANKTQVNLQNDKDNLQGLSSHVAQNAKARGIAGNEGLNGDGVIEDLPTEHGGQSGPEPTRYGDWEKKGRCTDF